MLALVLLLAGCGSGDSLGRVPVGGQVSLNGTPVKLATIRFIPIAPTTGPAAVATIRDGRFELPADEGPVAGAHRVEIEALDYLGFALDDEPAFAAQAAKGRPLPKNPIPAAFNQNSKLTVELPPEGNRELNFQLDIRKGT